MLFLQAYLGSNGSTPPFSSAAVHPLFFRHPPSRKKGVRRLGMKFPLSWKPKEKKKGGTVCAFF